MSEAPEAHLLSHAKCHEFWKSFNDPTIYRVIAFMESVESWTQDEKPEVDQALSNLSAQLNDIDSVDLKNADQFIKICAHIKTSQILRLLQHLDSANPGSASKIIAHAEEGRGKDPENSKFFIQRNIAFERLRLLSRIFSANRINLVQQALEGDYDL